MVENKSADLDSINANLKHGKLVIVDIHYVSDLVGCHGFGAKPKPYNTTIEYLAVISSDRNKPAVTLIPRQGLILNATKIARIGSKYEYLYECKKDSGVLLMGIANPENLEVIKFG